MPDTIDNRELDQLLGFRENLAANEFVLSVMRKVQHERRRRKVILLVFGLIGAAFGLLGAVLLAKPIADLFAGLPLIGTMQAVLIVVAAAAFYCWMMNEDSSLNT
jgi:uncharacterized protein YacL